MALIKQIQLPSGIIVNYHRVVSVNNITNHASIIEIASYTSKEKRQEELLALQNNQDMNIFIETQRIQLPYNPEMNVDLAYQYLKTTDKYIGSQDDM